MKKIFLISLSIITWYTPMKSMDPDTATILIGRNQIVTSMAPIKRFSPTLAGLIEHRSNADAPITIPGCPKRLIIQSLNPMVTIMCAADMILQPDPDAREGSYKELRERILAHMDPRGTLQLMQLGQAVGIDQRITKALSLNIACLPKNTMLGILEKLYKQQEIELRKGIITQYALANRHKMPETGHKEENPKFLLSDILIHAKPNSRISLYSPLGS